MSDKRFRRTMEERRADPKRVFSFKFTQDNPKHQAARQRLEKWEEEYMEEYDNESPLADIIADMIHDFQYDRPSPLMDEKKLAHMVHREMREVKELLREIAERDPVIIQEANTARKSKKKAEDIDDDFISGMLDDFNSGKR